MSCPRASKKRATPRHCPSIPERKASSSCCANCARVLRDVVREVRMYRPLVLTSTFIGAPTDGHGHHQVSGEMAQEAFLAAGNPNLFPDQIRDGLLPWQPLKVYARMPFFSITEKGMYDYATQKWQPVRFHD